MNKTIGVVSVFFVVLIGVLLYFIFRTTPNNKSFWFPTYSYESNKKPYDVDVLIDLIKHQVNKDSFHRLTKSFHEVEVDSGSNALYVFVKRKFQPDSLQTAAVLNFVKQGNTAFISAENFGSQFAAQLLKDPFYKDCSKDPNLGQFVLEDQDTILFTLNSNTDTFRLEPLRFAESWLPNRSFNTDLLQCDTHRFEAQILGETLHCKPNYIRVKLDSGYLFLHSLPLAFTNFSIKQEEQYTYAKACFESLEFNSIYWDELRFVSKVISKGNNSDEEGEVGRSPFEQIFANRALKSAFLILLIGIVLFILVAIKRKRMVIEVYVPPVNASVSFSQTIARLYWLHPNHKKMAELKMNAFLNDVRTRYGIPINVLDERFATILSNKSGIKLETIKLLNHKYKAMYHNANISSVSLFQLVRQINFIKRNWK